MIPGVPRWSVWRSGSCSGHLGALVFRIIRWDRSVRAGRIKKRILPAGNSGRELGIGFGGRPAGFEFGGDVRGEFGIGECDEGECFVRGERIRDFDQDFGVVNNRE